ncbi:ORF-102 [Buzura suppressaria nucleopolyhedrovirus]|uniref:ORF-102 n=1 Tax=Buzura suppressaria nuclear polyhedrosis virus TaxID=74320 RepID=W5VKM9_NPVBS|nr:ORF-102 [Buzura suppressaria nucleopolyhedrovirus]AHH82691.1 ORF-102 [Buzura suppressaria nucleopolyhedrovirus]QYF10575.1 hypothetical protein [Buzura suppressaria nucleopolyhedrovirus]
MQIGAYIIEVSTVDFGSIKEMEDLLKENFCVIFFAHTNTKSFAVCEDIMYTNNGLITYRNFENYTHDNESSVIVIKKTDSLENIQNLVEDVYNELPNYDNVVMEWYQM